MGQLHALGLAGGAGGVDDGRQRVGFQRMDFERRRRRRQERVDGVDLRERRLAFARCRSGGRLDADDGRQRGHEFAQAGQGPGGVQHQEAGIGVVDAPGDVLGIVDHIQGHHDQSHAQGRLVDRHPLHAVLQADGDAIAFLEAARAEGLLPARGEGDHLRDRIIAPRRTLCAVLGRRACLPLPVQHLVRRVRMTLQQLCEVVHPGVPGGARMRSIDKVLESGTNGGRR